MKDHLKALSDSFTYCSCSHLVVFAFPLQPTLNSEPVAVRVQEGDVASFTVLRAGRADFVATVMYRVEYGNTSPGDFAMLSNDTLLVYDVGEWMKNISVAVEDDNTPETDESFHIVLYNATGECVFLFECASEIMSGYIVDASCFFFFYYVAPLR